MNPILTDTSDQAMANAVASNMGGMFRLFSRLTPEEHYEKGKFTRWYTALSHPWFNGIIASELPSNGDEIFLEESIQYFRSKGLSAFTFWTDPHVKTIEWQPLLSKLGFGFTKDTPGMAIDLNTMDKSFKLADGCEIRPVTNESELDDWAEAFVDGYGLPPDWGPKMKKILLSAGFDFPMRSYTGYLDGKPVSSSMIYYGGGAAGIYCVATLPKARGKGFGTAITLQPLLDAVEKGYRVGILQASDMGYPIYKKMGFRHLCQVENFYLAL